MARGASPRAECVVAPVLVKIVNGDFERIWAARETRRKALPLAAMHRNMGESRDSRESRESRGRMGLVV